MNILLHRRFEKKYAKLDETVKRRFKERRDLFLINPDHPLLHNHELTGKLSSVWSTNITGDYRAHYVKVDANTLLFIDIDTHNNLYGT